MDQDDFVNNRITAEKIMEIILIIISTLVAVFILAIFCMQQNKILKIADDVNNIWTSTYNLNKIRTHKGIISFRKHLNIIFFINFLK